MKRLFLLVGLLGVLLFSLAACGGSDTAVSPASADMDMSTLPVNIDAATTAVLKERDDVVVLDVREQWEYDEGHIPGVVHIPMNNIPMVLDQIPTDKTVIVTCRSGNRSDQVTAYLRQNGFDKVHNMSGGILSWQAAGLPVEK